MKITETADYLRVAIHTLETKIAPEMTSSDGQAAAAILGRVLTELRRREEVSAPVLAASVSVARPLAKQLRDLAADNGVPVTVAATDNPDQADFSSLALQHAALTQEIEALSSTLASRRSDLKDAAAQDQLSALLLEVGQWDEAFPSAQRTIALPAAPEAPPLPGNVLVDNGRITGVLDWECSNIGAPEQDLAYIRPIISQHIDWNRFIDHYEASGGRKINRGAMDFYMAFAAMRLCVIFNKGVKNLQDGVNSDIRYGIIDLDLTPEFMKQALVCTLKNYSQ